MGRGLFILGFLFLTAGCSRPLKADNCGPDGNRSPSTLSWWSCAQNLEEERPSAKSWLRIGKSVTFNRSDGTRGSGIVSEVLGDQRIKVRWTDASGQGYSKILPATDVRPSNIQRRYPPISTADTIIYSPDKGARGLHQAEIPLFADHEILKIHAPKSQIRLGTGGSSVTADLVEDRHVIQQQGLRACVAAASVMLVLDAKKDPNLEALFTSNLGHSYDVLRALKDAGLQGRVTWVGKDFAPRNRIGITVQEQAFVVAEPGIETSKALAKLLSENGPAVLSIGGEIGGHVVMLDSIDVGKNTAVIRDPYHGWMITVSVASLLQRTGRSIELVQSIKN